MEPDLTIIPNHLGLILDGNRRWAHDQDLSSQEGHYRGYQVLKDIAKYAFDKGVTYVSAFVFSTENWTRTKKEVRYLLDLTLKALTKDLAELNEEGIRVLWLGSTNLLSDRLIKAIKRAEEKTRNNTHGTLCLCFNYGGQQEIVDAVKKIVASQIPADEITQATVAGALYAPEVPSIDLIIRTSGEQRLSGFMLYRSEYSELYFTNKHWPAFTKFDLDKILSDYAIRHRRFGK
jgi:undecaprenyl diphosphate synthase